MKIAIGLAIALLALSIAVANAQENDTQRYRVDRSIENMYLAPRYQPQPNYGVRSQWNVQSGVVITPVNPTVRGSTTTVQPTYQYGTSTGRTERRW